MTLSKAWGVYDKWLEDPRVKFYPEPRNLDAAFRKMTEPFAAQPATKAVGDGFCSPMRKKFKPRWSPSTMGSTGYGKETPEIMGKNNCARQHPNLFDACHASSKEVATSAL